MTIQMIESSVGEALHLFGIMEKHQVPCSLELKIYTQADPFVGVASQPVKAEYLETFKGEGTGDTVVITLGESEFAFELDFTVAKYITDSQIDLCIAKENYSAWFSSGHVSPEGINEALKYREANDDDERYPVNISGYEERLLYFLRSLEMDDLLDAHDGLMSQASKALAMSQKKSAQHELLNSKSFKDRSEVLKKLANLIGEANEDYRNHILI